MGWWPPWVTTPLVKPSCHFSPSKKDLSEACLWSLASKLFLQLMWDAKVGEDKKPKNMRINDDDISKIVRRKYGCLPDFKSQILTGGCQPKSDSRNGLPHPTFLGKTPMMIRIHPLPDPLCPPSHHHAIKEQHTHAQH